MAAGDPEHSERDALREQVEEFVKDGDSGAASSGLIDALTEKVGGLRQLEQAVERIGPYHIERELGQGGQAIVYLGRHERSGARVAIKAVPATVPALVRMLRDESAALARVSSPHVVPVFDAGQDEHLAWVAMQYIPGVDLETWLQQERVPRQRGLSSDPRFATVALPVNTPARLARLVGWFRDLARTVARMHAVELLHRDIKPSNILIRDEPFPYLIDFGLARREGMTVRGVLAGTIPFDLVLPVFIKSFGQSVRLVRYRTKNLTIATN